MSSIVIELDDFTGENELQRAEEIRNFLRGQKDWIKPDRPDLWGAYHKRKLALATLTEAVLGGIQAVYTVRQNRDMVAFARAVPRLHVEHPTTHREYDGRFIDYVANPDISDEEHDEIFKALAGRDGYTGLVMAALRRDEAKRTRGIPRNMAEEGQPSWLEVQRDEDVFGLASVHDLQFYVTQVSAEQSLVASL